MLVRYARLTVGGFAIMWSKVPWKKFKRSILVLLDQTLYSNQGTGLILHNGDQDGSVECVWNHVSPLLIDTRGRVKKGTLDTAFIFSNIQMVVCVIPEYSYGCVCESLILIVRWLCVWIPEYSYGCVCESRILIFRWLCVCESLILIFRWLCVWIPDLNSQMVVCVNPWS